LNMVRWLSKNLLERNRVSETHPYVPDSLNVDAGSPRPTAVISERPSTLLSGRLSGKDFAYGET
jgi:hypothetical protein